MADFLSKPQNVQQVDDKAGNAFTIFTVQHTATTAGDENAVELDASVIDVRHLPSAGQTAVTVTLDASADTTLWTKTASFPSESASGTYTLCARHSGSAASVGGYKGDL
jgi:hypothetical protein